MKKIIVAAILAVSAIVLTGVIVTAASGMSGGAPGNYKTGCTPCHGSQSGNLKNATPPGPDQPTGKVTITGATQASVGQKETYSVQLDPSSLPLGVDGGIDAAIEDQNGNQVGGLAPGQNTKNPAPNVDNEIVQSGTTSRSWTFDWTPSASGTYTLYVAANAVNGDTLADGDSSPLPYLARDHWYLSQLTITVN